MRVNSVPSRGHSTSSASAFLFGAKIAYGCACRGTSVPGGTGPDAVPRVEGGGYERGVAAAVRDGRAGTRFLARPRDRGGGGGGAGAVGGAVGAGGSAGGAAVRGRGGD